jgi:hypothetical protein
MNLRDPEDVVLLGKAFDAGKKARLVSTDRARAFVAALDPEDIIRLAQAVWEGAALYGVTQQVHNRQSAAKKKGIGRIQQILWAMKGVDF